jgi:hypothetical protein
MQNTLKRTLPLLAATMVAWGGGLSVEIGNPDANPEARRHKAVLVARVTACHDPAASTVAANLVSLNGEQVKRTPLKIQALSTAGSWAVSGASEGVIEVTVSNPQYGTYSSTALVRVSSAGIRWGGLRHLGGKQTTAADVRAVLTDEAAASRP